MKKKGSTNRSNQKLLAALVAVTMCVMAIVPTVTAGAQSLGTSPNTGQIIGKSTPMNPNPRNTWDVPGDFDTIQEAIDDASVMDGDTIVVAAGTYNEDQITVNKVLTIQGAGWEGTVIDGGDAELASDGLIRIIATGDVTFTGFTIQNAGGPSNGGDGGDGYTNIGVYASSSSPSAIYTISQNKIIGTNNDADEEDYGLYASSGQEHLIFTSNIITQTGGNSVLIEINPGETDISYNMIDAGCWGVDPIYYFTYDGNDITTLQKVSNNTIDVSTGSNPREPGYNKITGIGFSGAWKGYFWNESADTGEYTKIVVSDNTITGVGVWNRGIALDNFAWGDGTGGEISDAVITGNTMTGPSTPVDWDSSQCFGIRLSGLVTDTIIRENHIMNCWYSFFGTVGFSWDSLVYPAGTVVHYNTFKDNGYGLRWEGSTYLDALYNYWGSPSGPSPVLSGDGVYGLVNYTPYIDNDPPWEVILSYTRQGSGYTWDTTFFGETLDASDGQDSADVPKPSIPPTPYIYTYFDAGLSDPYQHLWKDYRRFLHEQEVWDLYVVSDNDVGSTMDIDMSWNTANVTASEYDFVDLYDAGDTHLADMTTEDTYSIVGLADNTPLHLKIKCGVNHIPVALPDVESVLENSTSNQLFVLTNDFDVDGNTLTITSVTSPTHGASSHAGTYCSYTPTAGYHGSDSFTYTISDGFGGSATATISLTVVQLHTLDVKANWNIISNPCNSPVAKTDIVVRYAGTTYTWDEAVDVGLIIPTIFGWNAVSQGYYQASTLNPGEGYWCWAYYDVQFYIWSDAVGSGHIADLKTRWNLIGLSYETPLNIADIIVTYGGTNYTWAQAVANNIVLGFVYGWENNVYTLETTLKPDRGYWMYAYHDCVIKRNL
jgi:hypothetical protein